MYLFMHVWNSFFYLKSDPYAWNQLECWGDQKGDEKKTAWMKEWMIQAKQDLNDLSKTGSVSPWIVKYVLY